MVTGAEKPRDDRGRRSCCQAARRAAAPAGAARSGADRAGRAPPSPREPGIAARLRAGVVFQLPLAWAGSREARMGTLGEKVQNLPGLPGVYLFKDAQGRVLYVGKAKSLLHRVRSYLSGENGHPRLAELMGRAADVDTILTQTEGEALLLEATLIRQHRPHFNILLKDDKSFPYVRLSVQ